MVVLRSRLPPSILIMYSIVGISNDVLQCIKLKHNIDIKLIWIFQTVFGIILVFIFITCKSFLSFKTNEWKFFENSHKLYHSFDFCSTIVCLTVYLTKSETQSDNYCHSSLHRFTYYFPITLIIIVLICVSILLCIRSNNK